MADYDSEREQIEALKRWWKENGWVVAIGLLLGLGAVFGWTSWQAYTRAQAEQASAAYQELVNWAAAENHLRVEEAAERLMREFPDSAYATLGALVRARSALEKGALEEAQGYLQWAMDNAESSEIERIARLRLARLLLGEGEHDRALELLDVIDPGPFAPLYDELRGDVLAVEGRAREAYEHYRRALAAPRLTPGSRARIELKVADLGLGDAGALGLTPEEATDRVTEDAVTPTRTSVVEIGQ